MNYPTIDQQIHEVERIKALRRYEILDTPPDGSFDKLAALAAKIFNVPIALITLVDRDRIWFKSRYGLENVEQIGRDPGLCASAILSNEIFIIEDAKNDPRSLHNPLVRGEFGLEYYAAFPLHTRDGYNLGTFCIIDKRKRHITIEQLSLLQTLSEIVMDAIELRLAARRLARENEQIIKDLRDRIKNN